MNPLFYNVSREPLYVAFGSGHSSNKQVVTLEKPVPIPQIGSNILVAVYREAEDLLPTQVVEVPAGAPFYYSNITLIANISNQPIQFSGGSNSSQILVPGQSVALGKPGVYTITSCYTLKGFGPVCGKNVLFKGFLGPKQFINYSGMIRHAKVYTSILPSLKKEGYSSQKEGYSNGSCNGNWVWLFPVIFFLVILFLFLVFLKRSRK